MLNLHMDRANITENGKNVYSLVQKCNYKNAENRQK